MLKPYEIKIDAVIIMSLGSEKQLAEGIGQWDLIHKSDL